jgi:hypothetical protein
MRHAQKWNCDKDGGENLYHKSIQQIKFLTPKYNNNDWRTSGINYVPTASAICGVKTEN